MLTYNLAIFVPIIFIIHNHFINFVYFLQYFIKIIEEHIIILNPILVGG